MAALVVCVCMCVYMYVYLLQYCVHVAGCSSVLEPHKPSGGSGANVWNELPL